MPKPDDNLSEVEIELKEEYYESSEYESSDELDESDRVVILEYDGMAVGTQLEVETEKHRPVESSPPVGEAVIKSVPNRAPGKHPS